MIDDVDSAFVEIAARAPEVDAAADRLLPLYVDAAHEQVPEASPLAPARGVVLGCAAMLLVVTVLALIAVALAATGASPEHPGVTPSSPLTGAIAAH